MACGLWYNIRMKNNQTHNTQCVLYVKAGVIEKTRTKIAEGSRAFLETGVVLDRIDRRKVGIVSKDFWENVLTKR